MWNEKSWITMEIILFLLVCSLLLPLIYIVLICLAFKIFDRASCGEMTREVNDRLFPHESIYPDEPKQR